MEAKGPTEGEDQLPKTAFYNLAQITERSAIWPPFDGEANKCPECFPFARDVNGPFGDKAREEASLSHPLLLVRLPTQRIFRGLEVGRTISIVILAETKAGGDHRMQGKPTVAHIPF